MKKIILSAVLDLVSTLLRALSFLLFWNLGIAFVFHVPAASYVQCLAVAIAIEIVLTVVTVNSITGTLSLADQEQTKVHFATTVLNTFVEPSLCFFTAVAGIVLLRIIA